MRPILLLMAAAIPALPGVPEFRASTPITGLKMGYQLVLADLNRDGKPDIIVVDERSTELAWYENPTWARHVLAENTPRVINLDTADLDGDGIPEIALAHHFERDPQKSLGTILLLKSGPNPREKWTAKEIDRVPTAHRLRWIRTNELLLLVAPLVGPNSREPDYADAPPIYAYRPRSGWKRETISKDLEGVLHSIAPVDWLPKGPQHLLTASFAGIDRLEPSGSGAWKRHRIANGDPRPCPECGSSEIKMGRAGKRRILAAIEPWHGNQLVVYTDQKDDWTRSVLDDSMVNGHALAVADLDGDGSDEIIAGFRGKGFRLSVFYLEGATWVRHVLDEGGVAGADCKTGDLNGDGRIDIACSGASTGNVMIFENLGTRRSQSAGNGSEGSAHSSQR